MFDLLTCYLFIFLLQRDITMKLFKRKNYHFKILLDDVRYWHEPSTSSRPLGRSYRRIFHIPWKKKQEVIKQKYYFHNNQKLMYYAREHTNTLVVSNFLWWREKYYN